MANHVHPERSNEMGKLTNKRALVTGGGQGLGYAVVEQLLEAGADVAIHYLTSEAGARELKELADKKGRRAEIFRADLTKQAEIDLKRFGELTNKLKISLD